MGEILTYFLPLLIAAGAFLDVVAGYLPDRWVPYIGFVRRIIRRLSVSLQRSKTTHIIALIALPTLVMAGCSFSTGPTAYTQEAYPASILVDQMTKQGIHPEQTAARIWRFVRAEIRTGVFTSDEVVAWCNEKLGTIDDITYVDLFGLFEGWIDAFDAGNPIISQAVVVGLFIMEEQFASIMQYHEPLLSDDVTVIKDLLIYIRDKAAA